VKKRRRKPGELMSALDEARDASSDLRVRTLLHELQVHSEEITVQNEQLLKAQAELEHARDRYADLYDFAPIGYMSMDQHGKIAEINLAGAALLGRPRQNLISQPLASMLSATDREVFREFLARSMRIVDHSAPEVEVTIKTSNHVLRLITRPMTQPGEPSLLFTAMLDVTEQRLLEAERQRIHEAERQKAADLAREVSVRLTAEERVKALLDRLVDVQEQQRRRLALNLHNQLGQQLTALRLALDALRNAPLDSAEAQHRFEFIDEIVTQLDTDVDLLAWELRPPALDEVGLDAALREFLRQWAQNKGLTVDLHVAIGDGVRLPPDVESHLYRIVQEALNNVAKHAKAKHASVMLERRADEVTLIVEDDGRGFDVESTRRKRHGGIGLAGMQERAASVGGELQLESSAGNGTTLFVRLPIRPAAASH
jgi:PAS domain S-box-containing protein